MFLRIIRFETLYRFRIESCLGCSLRFDAIKSRHGPTAIMLKTIQPFLENIINAGDAGFDHFVQTPKFFFRFRNLALKSETAVIDFKPFLSAPFGGARGVTCGSRLCNASNSSRERIGGASIGIHAFSAFCCNVFEERLLHTSPPWPH